MLSVFGNISKTGLDLKILLCCRVIHARAYMSFHPSVNTVSFPSQNRGRLMVQIQKIGANMQSLKNEGKRAVRCENEGSFAIDPKS